MNLAPVLKTTASTVVLFLCVFFVSCDNGNPGSGDPTAPTGVELDVVYPTTALYTDGTSITVSGTATSSEPIIADITVGGITAVSNDGFATWSAEVPLDLGLNTFSIIAYNQEGSVEVTVDDMRVIREEYTLNQSDNIVHDKANNRVLLTADPYYADAAIMAVDLDTGAQTLFSSASQTDSGNDLLYPRSITVDAARNRGYLRVWSNVETIDLETGDRTAFNIGLLPNDVPVEDILGMVFDNLNDQLLLLAGTTNTSIDLISVDPMTLTPTLIEDTVDTNEAIVFRYVSGLEIDEVNNRVIVAGRRSGQNSSLVSIDLTTGDRTVLSDRQTPNAENYFNLVNNSALAIDSTNNKAYVAERYRGIIYEVDLMTGQRSIFMHRDSNNGLIDRPRGLFYDSEAHRIVVYDDGNNSLVQIDIATKLSSFISMRNASTSDIFL